MSQITRGYLPCFFHHPQSWRKKSHQAATARFASFAVSVPLPGRITLLARPDLACQVACHGALRTEMSEINLELLVANIHLILMFFYWFYWFLMALNFKVTKKNHQPTIRATNCIPCFVLNKPHLMLTSQGLTGHYKHFPHIRVVDKAWVKVRLCSYHHFHW